MILQGESLEALLSKSKYTLILYSLPIAKESLEILHQYSSNKKIPSFSLHSAGFYSYFQIYLPGTFPIVDTHPDETATTDLRLLKPWSELSAFVAELTDNVSEQSAHKHGHIPYLALLLYYLEQWKQENGSLPSTYKDKNAFKKFLAEGARTDNAEGGEENYDEAVAAVMKTISQPSLSSAVREVFEHIPNEVRIRLILCL